MSAYTLKTPDDQAAKVLNGPRGMRLEKKGAELTIHTTKVMDWFKTDFEKWGGGTLPFLIRHASPDKRKQIEAAGNQIDVEYDDYSWKLNDNSK